MIDDILLTQDDFKPYRDISENVDFDRLSTWILEAQKQEMRAFLGAELYLVMITDFDAGAFQEQRFIDLWDGLDVDDVDPPYRFYGLKPVIIYFAYARFLKNQQTVVTRYGVKHLVRDESEDQTAISNRVKQGDAENMAISLQNDAAKFLNDHEADYPEYEFFAVIPNQKNIYIPINRNRRWGGIL